MAGAVTNMTLPYQASAAIVKARFQKLTGDQTVAPCAAITDKALGVVDVDVSAAEVTNGKSFAVHTFPDVVWVEAAAAIARGAQVAPSANGRAQTAVTTQFVAGVCLRGAGAAGDLALVQLTSPAILAL